MVAHQRRPELEEAIRGILQLRQDLAALSPRERDGGEPAVGTSAMRKTLGGAADDRELARCGQSGDLCLLFGGKRRGRA